MSGMLQKSLFGVGMRCLVVVLCLWGLVEADTCLRRPHPSVTRSPKSSGDNGFKIIVNGDPDRYIPGEFYAITLVGARTHNQLQTFTRFSIGAEPRDPNAQSSPLTHGQFQLFADTMSTFDEDCVNVVKEANDLPKTEVQVQWMAPKAGSGCVQIKAMVFENPRKWFAEDGQLTKLICEQTRKETVVLNEECCALDEAKYNMVFEGLWSNVTHPKDFPFSLWLTHFSDVIGASHEKNFSFWGEGKIASDGFRSLAEWGSVRLMEQELVQQKKHLKTIIKAPGLWYPNVNTNTTSTFRVDNKKHLVSLASMLGPTPDWVVGVDGLDLCMKNCSWVENIVMDLYLYDAGTDSGITYMSPNSETKPREKMFRITTKYPEDERTPFYDPYKDEMNPFARLFLFRDKIIPKSYDEQTLQRLTLSVSENTDDVENPACAVSEYSEWTPCSVTCGKGLRMRTREYVMPEQKVKMFNCNRQLVSREMCVADVPECDEDAASENDDQEIEQSPGETGVCATGDWTEWSECSATCGIGFKMRTRYFLDHMGRKKCPQVITVEKDKCMKPECRPEDIEIPDPNCPVTPWSDWSQCSTSCGQGIRLRMRMLLVEQELKDECSQRVLLTEHAPCSVRESCQLDMATAKRVCMEPVNTGLCKSSIERWAFNTEKAMCVPFVYKGCKGNRNNFLSEQDCLNTCGIVRDALIGGSQSSSEADTRLEENEDELSRQPQFPRIPPRVQQFQTSPQLAFNPSQRIPASSLRQDCMFTDWSEWSQCSASCGRGFISSFRTIKAQAQNGGKACPRKLHRRKGCFLGNC